MFTSLGLRRRLTSLVIYARFFWSREGRQLPTGPRTDPGVRNYRTGLLPWIRSAGVG
jgi:hypothetical protein